MSELPGERRTKPVERVTSVRFESGAGTLRMDDVAGEEPLEVRVRAEGGTPRSIGVTMRTPGHDFELAVGLLHSEGVLGPSAQVRDVRYCDLHDDEAQRWNIVTVTVAGPIGRGPSRTGVMSASCGLCGSATLADLARRVTAPDPATRIPLELLVALPTKLRSAQRAFDRTGGLHAAGAVDVTSGEMLVVREDVGRHNALDKVVGWAALQHRLPLSNCAVVVSGRVSFELVQKAALAGVPVLAAVSAPSSLAIRAADELGLLLAGFVRDGRATAYSGSWRVSLPQAVPSSESTPLGAHAAASAVEVGAVEASASGLRGS